MKHRVQYAKVMCTYYLGTLLDFSFGKIVIRLQASVEHSVISIMREALDLDTLLGYLIHLYRVEHKCGST